MTLPPQKKPNNRGQGRARAGFLFCQSTQLTPTARRISPLQHEAFGRLLRKVLLLHDEENGQEEGRIEGAEAAGEEEEPGPGARSSRGAMAGEDECQMPIGKKSIVYKLGGRSPVFLLLNIFHVLRFSQFFLLLSPSRETKNVVCGRIGMWKDIFFCLSSPDYGLYSPPRPTSKESTDGGNIS